MNTATRAYGRSFVVGRSASFRLTTMQMAFAVLLFLLFCSAFLVVYAKDLNRRHFVQYQNLQKTEQQYRVEWTKLLLEQGAMSTQSRIQQLAQSKESMLMPASKQIVLVRDSNVVLATNSQN